MKIHHLKQHQLSKSNTSDQNFIKLGHIIMYHNVFKFQNGPYHIMPSGVIALLLMTIPYLYKFGNSGGIRVPWTHFYFFSKSMFSKNSFRKAIRVSNSLDPDQTNILSCIIWIQTVFNSFQQTTLVSRPQQSAKSLLISIIFQFNTIL